MCGGLSRRHGYLRPSHQWHFPPDLAQKVVIDFGGCDFWLVVLVANIGQDHAPGVDNHAVAVAHPFLVVSPYLGRGNDVRLRLNGSRPEECLPMRLSRGDGEGRREGDDIAAKPLQGKTDLGEAKLDV